MMTYSFTNDASQTSSTDSHSAWPRLTVDSYCVVLSALNEDPSAALELASILHSLLPAFSEDVEK